MSTKKIIENAKRKGIILHEDHKLVTRRDFMAAGIIPFAASIMAPTIWSMLLKSSIAHADCQTVVAGTSEYAPFISVALRGGWGGSAQHVPIQADGMVPVNMGLMGLGGRALIESPRPGQTTGNRFESYMGSNRWFFNSGFLAGLRSQLDGTPDVERNTSFIQVCVQSGDDSDMNRQNLLGLVSSAGLLGSNVNSVVSQGFGNRPIMIAPSAPLSVGSVADLRNAVSIAEPLGSLTVAQKQKVFDSVKRLSDSRALALVASSAANATLVKDLTECATKANFDAADDPAPTVDPTVANTEGYNGIWGVDNNTNAGTRDKVFAACVYNSLKGQAGGVSLSLGGYDYHDNTRTTGDARDREAGVLVGRILRSAHASGKKCFLVLTSDGSVRSNDSQTSDTTAWTSDRGQNGTAMVFVYNPLGTTRPALSSGTDLASMTNQIGRYTAGQSADMNYIGSKWSLDAAGLAIFANYLKFSGRADWRTKYNQVVDAAASMEGTANPLTGLDIDTILRIA